MLQFEIEVRKTRPTGAEIVLTIRSRAELEALGSVSDNIESFGRP